MTIKVEISVYQINAKKKTRMDLLNQFVRELNCKIYNVDVGYFSYSFDIEICEDNIQDINNIICKYSKAFKELDEDICVRADIRY